MNSVGVTEGVRFPKLLRIQMDFLKSVPIVRKSSPQLVLIYYIQEVVIVIWKA